MKAFSKLFLVLALALCLICAMVACGDKNDETAESSDNAAVTTTEAPAETTTEAEETTTEAPAETTTPAINIGGDMTEPDWSAMGGLGQQ